MKLDHEQKRLLDQWIRENWKGPGHRLSFEDISIFLMNQLEMINDHETIRNNINEYIDDKTAKELYLK